MANARSPADDSPDRRRLVLDEIRDGLTPRGAGRPSLALVAALVLVGGALWGLRWAASDRHASGDTFWYGRAALMLAGASAEDATADAARYVVDLGLGTDASSWIHTAETIDRRYPAIFESRPVYPLVAAALVPLLGLDALIASALLAGLSLALGIGLVAHALTGSRLAAIGAVALAYALPSGEWLTFLYADGWMMALLVVALGCASIALLGGGRSWIAGFAAALVLLYASKTANGAVLVVALVALAGLSLAARSPTRQRVLVLASIAATIGLGQVVLFGVIGAPGLVETLQDYFTRHFATPDVADPVRLLIRRDVNLLPKFLVALLGEPAVLVTAASGLGVLVLARTSWASLWLLTGIGSALTVVIHPLASEVPRLMGPVWLAVALGLSLLVPPLARATRRSA